MAKHLSGPIFFTGSNSLFRTCHRVRSAEKVAWAIKYSALSMSHLETECRMTILSNAFCILQLLKNSNDEMLVQPITTVQLRASFFSNSEACRRLFFEDR